MGLCPKDPGDNQKLPIYKVIKLEKERNRVSMDYK